jgi:hypothetical protein
MKMSKNNIASFLIGNDFSFCPKFAALVSDDFTNAIDGGFVVGGRFCFDELLKKGAH